MNGFNKQDNRLYFIIIIIIINVITIIITVICDRDGWERGGSEVGPGEDLPYISNMVCAAQGLEVVYREQARIPY